MPKTTTPPREGHQPTIYRRRLPHIQPLGTLLFITFRLIDSLPVTVLAALRRERNALEAELDRKNIEETVRQRWRMALRRRSFTKLDKQLERMGTGPTWLGQPEVADIVRESILYRHPDQYELICFTIMPNHVHMVFTHTRKDLPVYDIIAKLKSFTAHQANKALGRKGPFWQRESFDHVVRAGQLPRTIRYVLDNPVAAGLAPHWRDWPYSWLNPDFG